MEVGSVSSNTVLSQVNSAQPNNQVQQNSHGHDEGTNVTQVESSQNSVNSNTNNSVENVANSSSNNSTDNTTSNSINEDSALDVIA